MGSRSSVVRPFYRCIYYGIIIHKFLGCYLFQFFSIPLTIDSPLRKTNANFD